MREDMSDRLACQLELNEDFLKKGDFVVKGKLVEWKLEISGVERDELQEAGRNSKKKKFVLAFNGRHKRLVLNITNIKALKKMHGEKVSEWIGKEIIAFFALTEPIGGKPIRNPSDPDTPGGIRVKAVK